MVYNDVVSPAQTGTTNSKHGNSTIFIPGITIKQVLEGGYVRPVDINESRLTDRFDDTQYYGNNNNDLVVNSTVAVYRFDESGNVTRVGSVGTEPDLVVSNGNVVSDTGILNLCAKAGGDYNNYSLTANAPIAGVRSCTISAWVKDISGGLGGNSPAKIRIIADDGISSHNISLGIPNTSNALFEAFNFSTFGNPAVINDAPPTQDVWRHYVGTYDNATGTAKFYINGVLIGTSTDALSIFSFDLTTIVLTWDGANITAIDQLEITNKAEDADWVSSRYNNGNGFDPTA